MSQIAELDPEKIYIGKCNVRRTVGDITELTMSIEERGVLEPIIVRPVGERYELVVGSRRFEAARAAGLKRIPAIIREMDDGEATALSLIENIQRGNLETEEEIEGMRRLMNLDREKYGTQQKLAKELGLRQSTISTKFTAYDLIIKLRKGGREIKLKAYPTEEEREKIEAIPIEHARLIEEAFKTEGVKKLPKEELEKKRVEIVEAVTPLSQIQVRKVLNHFKMFPTKPTEVIVEEALARERGVAIHVYFAPRIARALSEAAEDRNTTMEELVPIAVEEWLKQVGYLD